MEKEDLDKMSKLNTILIVEDNPTYIAPARDFFISQQDAIHEIVLDYEAAVSRLKLSNYSGVITDCFFPEKQLCDERTLGFHAVEKMRGSDPRGRKDNPLAKAIKQVGNLISGTNGIVFAEQLVGNTGKRLRDVADLYWILEKAIEADPSNQPLGILVAEQAENKKIPFVLATSSHHHDMFTQPIQDYCNRKGWTLIDCPTQNPNEKATPEFWKRTYDALKLKIGDAQ